jgi:transcription antitermination protein NusB
VTEAASQRRRHSAKSHARRLALQALYQMQINPVPWQDVFNQIAAGPDADRADRDYFRSLLQAVAESRHDLDQRLAAWCEIKPGQLDPIEHAALWLGVHELTQSMDIPYRVVLSETVDLAKRFGATDGHKFVNAVLDLAARELRANEYGKSSYGAR